MPVLQETLFTEKKKNRVLMDISQNSCNLDKGKMTRRGIKTQKYFFFLPSLPSPPSPPFQMAPQIYFLEDIS